MNKAYTTTYRRFPEWSQVFPSGACVVAMIDRIIHHADIVHIDGKSYRAKEANERAEKRASKRNAKKVKNKFAQIRQISQILSAGNIETL